MRLHPFLTGSRIVQPRLWRGRWSKIPLGLALIVLGLAAPLHAQMIVECAPERTIRTETNCEAVVPDLSESLMLSENGSPLTILQVPPAGAPVGPGATNITFLVSNETGETNTCEAKLNVLHETAPGIICPPEQFLFANTGCETAIPDMAEQTVAIADCVPVAITQSPSAGTLVGLGMLQVTITVTDLAGNQASCEVAVTVQDTAPPIIVACAPDLVGSADNDCGYEVPDFTTQVAATDNCAIMAIFQEPLPGSRVVLGTNLVSLTVWDGAGNTSTCTNRLIVLDTTPPEFITHPFNQFLSTGPNCTATMPNLMRNIEMMDACGTVALSQSPAPGVTLTGADRIVTLTATDLAGNIATCTAQIYLTDTNAPTVTCPNDIQMNIPSGSPGVTVSFNPQVHDNCAGVTVACIPPSGSVFPVGTNEVGCNAQDIRGNSAQCLFSVLINREPIAGLDSIVTVQNNTASVPISWFLANDADLDGEVIVLSEVSQASTNGGMVVLSGTNVLYTPVPGFAGADLFTYTVRDKLGATSPGVVCVEVLTQSGAVYNHISELTMTSGRADLTISSVPGKTVHLERSSDCKTWTVVDTATVPPDARAHLKDANAPSGNAYYRIFTE